MYDLGPIEDGKSVNTLLSPPQWADVSACVARTNKRKPSASV